MIYQDTPRFVRQPFYLPKRWQKKDTAANLTGFYTQLDFGNNQKTWLAKTLINQKRNLTDKNQIDSKTCWPNEN